MLDTWIKSSQWPHRLFCALALFLSLSVMGRAQEGNSEQYGLSSAELIGRMADPVDLSDTPHNLGPSFSIRHGKTQPANVIRRGDRREWVLGTCKGAGVLSYVGIEQLKGTLRVFLNGDPRPAIEIESPILFQGQSTLFSGAFSGRSTSGWGMWFPVTFSASAQVTVDADPGESEVIFRRVKRSQPTQTFRMKAAIIGSFRAGEALGKLNGAATKMPLNASSQGAFTAVTGQTLMLEIPANKKQVVYTATEETGGVLTHFGVEDLGGFLNDETSQKTLLSIKADGVTTVDRLPLLDVLGAPLGGVQSSQFLAGATVALARHYRLSVPMPFAKTIEISMSNMSAAPLHGMALLAKVETRKWTSRSRHLFALRPEAKGEPVTLDGSGEVRGWLTRQSGPCSIQLDDSERVLDRGLSGSGGSALATCLKPREGVTFRNRWMLLDAPTFERRIAISANSGLGVVWVYLRPPVTNTQPK